MKATKIIAVLAVALMAAGTVGLTSCKGKDKGKTASTKEAKGKKKGKAKKVELPEDAFDVEFTKDESGCIIKPKVDAIEEIVVGNDVTYPSTVQGLPVKGIKLTWCDYNASSLTIPEGVVWLKTNCDDSEKPSLTKVTLPSTLKVLGPSVFSGCTNLSECNLPEGLEVISVKAFQRTSLKSVTLPKSLRYYIMDGSGPFSLCDSLEEINIPEGLKITRVHAGSEEFFSGEKIESSLALQKTIKDKLKVETLDLTWSRKPLDDYYDYMEKNYPDF